MSKIKKSGVSLPSARRWTQWKERDACRALGAWRRSGLSAAAFCAREGYSETRLRYWLGRLGEQPSRSAPPVSFVPVALGDVQRTRQIEIERDGVVVRVREDLAVEHVARLVAALGAVEAPC